MSANLVPSFTAIEQKVPVMTIASVFQKDPFVFMSHPGQGFDKWEDLNKRPFSSATRRWLHLPC